MFYLSKAQLEIIADIFQNFQKTEKSTFIHPTTVITLDPGASYNNLSQVAQNWCYCYIFLFWGVSVLNWVWQSKLITDSECKALSFIFPFYFYTIVLISFQNICKAVITILRSGSINFGHSYLGGLLSNSDNVGMFQIYPKIKNNFVLMQHSFWGSVIRS